MEEFSLINLIRQTHYSHASLVKGVGDDAAVFRQNTQDIVTAVDTFVENVHFSNQTMSAFQIGYRALAANISDMSAMGAKPAFYLVSIVVPKIWSENDVLEIFTGMKALASECTMDLIGGDTVSGTELVISVTIIGYVDKSKARYRHTAKYNDIVFVTGTLGDARAGLHILQNKDTYQNETYFIKRHQQPTPRVNFSRSLLPISRIALNDVSDGIANEAIEIAEASKVNIVLIADKIPVSNDFKQFAPQLQHEWKYYGGEDFELLGTVPESDWDLVKQGAQDTDTKVTQIGYVSHNEESYGKVYLKDADNLKQIKKDGYTHLK